MKTLLILRHAKSSWANQNVRDHDRPLNKRGKRDAPRMGRLLQRQGLVPDRIISSTAERALNTAELVALNCDYQEEIETTPHFYLAAPQTYLSYLSDLGDEIERVLIVGHNPGMENLVWLLTGQDESFPTAALAQIELSIDEWSQVSGIKQGRLIQLWRPKELDREL